MCHTFPAFIAVCLLVLTLTGQALAQNDIQTQTGESTIRGVVTYNDTGHPLRNATVMVYANTGGYQSEVITGRRGEFVVENVPAGRYIMFISAPGILRPQVFRQIQAPLIAQLRLNEERDFFTEVVVNGTDGVDVKMKAVRGGVITGRVVTEDDQPLADADVRLLRSENGKWLPVGSNGPQGYEQWKTLKTDADGVYRIAGLTAGDYVVRVSEDTIASDATPSDDAYSDGSFMVTYYPAANTIKEAQAVTVVEGHESTGIDIRMPERTPHTISGRVLGPNNARGPFQVRIERAEEIAYASNIFEIIIPADNDGNWRVQGIPSGEYLVTISGTVLLEVSEQQTHPVLLARKWIKVHVADEDVVIPDTTMSLGSSVFGKVTLDGKPPGNSYRLYPLLKPVDDHSVGSDKVANPISSGKPPSAFGSYFVRSDGTFVIEAVPAGKYWLVMFALEEQPFYVKAVTRNGVDLMQTPIKLAKEQAFDDVMVALATDFASVEGEVARPAGEPKRSLGDLVVVLAAATDATRNAGRGWLTSHPDAQGKFTFSCAPGEYFLLVLAPDQLRKLPKPVDEKYFKNANQKFTRVKVRPAEKLKGLTVTLADK